MTDFYLTNDNRSTSLDTFDGSVSVEALYSAYKDC